MNSIVDLVCEALLISVEELSTFSQTAPHRYKKYTIPKRNGAGLRLIAQPSKEVKFIQRIVLKEIRTILPIHKCALAYEPNTGIKINASHHKNNSYLLKMDFRDFFPSITPFLLFSITKDFGISFDARDLEFLSRLLFYKSTRKSKLRLSIGAPTSPFISNFVMHGFDRAMYEYCCVRRINYTRYADDITFSSDEKGTLFEIPAVVHRLLKSTTYSQIKINPEKTIFSSRAFNRHVTGVVISNNRSLSIGREKKRLYSSMIYRFSQGLLDEAARHQLRGHLSYANYIEPDFLDRMKLKYSRELIDEILA